MQHWEYLQIRRDQTSGRWYENDAELAEGQQVDFHILNQWGQQGWELVAISTGASSTAGGITGMIFKRPKP